MSWNPYPKGGIRVSDATTSKIPKSAQEIASEEALTQLRKLGGELFREESVVFDGKKVVLPEGSTLKSNIDFLTVLMNEDGEQAEWRRVYKYRPLDGAVALHRALKLAFGAVKHSGGMSFFGPTPPRFIEVPTGIDTFESVPCIGDEISVPAFPDVTFVPYSTVDEELGEVFVLYAAGKKGRRFEVEGLFNLVETQLREHSIYKGKAITAGFDFIDLGKVKPEQVIYSEQVMFELERSVFGPIELDGELEDAGMDLKGAVLLHGPFGTGKTLAAYLTGQRAVEHGWTFILCGSEHDLFDALKAARQYAKAIVFYEDVDVLTAEADAERVQLLLEAFDGIRRKGEAVRVVLTSNYPERINKGLVRPGRIDAVIEIGKPDAFAIQRLTEMNCAKLDPAIRDEDWDKVTSAMEGYLPAFVVEAVKRAYMAALIRSKRKGGEVLVGSEDLRLAAESLRPQLAMMEGAADTREPDRLGAALASAVKPTVIETLRENVHPHLLVEL